MVNALLLVKSEAGFSAQVAQLEASQLPPGDVLVQVDWPVRFAAG